MRVLTNTNLRSLVAHRAAAGEPAMDAKNLPAKTIAAKRAENPTKRCQYYRQAALAWRH